MITAVQGGSGNGQNVRGFIQRLDLHQWPQESKRGLRDVGADQYPTASTSFRGKTPIKIDIISCTVGQSYLWTISLASRLARWAPVRVVFRHGLMDSGRTLISRTTRSSIKTFATLRLTRSNACTTIKLYPMTRANLLFTLELNGIICLIEFSKNEF